MNITKAYLRTTSISMGYLYTRLPNLHRSILACQQLVEHIAICHTKNSETSCKCPICSALTEGNEIAYSSAIKSFPNNSNFDSGKDFITKIADDLLAFGQCYRISWMFQTFWYGGWRICSAVRWTRERCAAGWKILCKETLYFLRLC